MSPTESTSSDQLRRPRRVHPSIWHAGCRHQHELHQEVQVKTVGFEPQYGQATGGIVNIITKSGGTEYHGSVYSFFQPESFEASRKQPDDLRTNKNGKILHQEGYDTGFDVGGPVPGLKDRLFFFGSFNPSINRDIIRGQGSGLATIYGDQTHRRKYTKNTGCSISTSMQATS
jgi:hypothetical protein